MKGGNNEEEPGDGNAPKGKVGGTKGKQECRGPMHELPQTSTCNVAVSVEGTSTSSSVTYTGHHQHGEKFKSVETEGEV